MKEEVISAINYVRKYKTETDRIEIKTANVSFPKKCYDTISSFSNKSGGLIIFGLSENNNFETEGVYDVNDLQKHLADLCTDAMEPSIRPEIVSFEFENKNIVAMKINEISQKQKPCYYKPKGLKSGSYIRIGDKDDVMTDYEIYALQSYNEHICEDKRPTYSSSIKDLNIKSIKSYFSLIESDKPNFANLSFENKLILSGIVVEKQKELYPTLTGTMLFGLYPQCFYPQLFVACVVVPGKKLGDTGLDGERFIDNKRVEGTIEEMLDGTLNFLRRNMKTKIIIDSLGKRTDITEYPIDALKEAVANALIHRDYSSYTDRGYISVNMYEDRLEIISPGALYGPNKLDKIFDSTFMEVRNPTIVKILEEKHSIVENRHTGIKTIMREMEKYNLPKPEFYEERDCFKVVFKNSIKYQEELLSGAQSGAQGGAQSGQQILLSDTQIKVLEYCNQAKSAKEIKEYLDIASKRYVGEKVLKPLIDLGMLEYTNKNNYKARNQKYITAKKEIK